ncbi:MAG: DUF3999 domain-containing protein [Gammaproteobacteria bacterium]|nr:DUF3999 domain-containing protein [Gammaproteobacteria bacterium]MCW8928345.1 DUF3999 domain-containing protein [Gammaproteobacteria bacterium]MCW8972819.1 DUF3999 domain-containing protein [Gammaproteobacteria bacterium]MCW8992108.1 DUF3999 domain-containing protein [Gammaproteobacteria bacterium]
MRCRIALALMLLPLSVMAQQGTPTPRDFAYGVSLEVDGDGALYSFDLPAEVYRYSTRDDLGDMRVFNGHGEVVPHLLKDGVKRSEGSREPVDLRLFPLYAQASGENGDTQVHIATDSSGAVVDFWQRSPSESAAVIRRYLIDASMLERPPEKLVLDWGETAESFLAAVTLEYSNDLSHWQSLPSHYTLAALSHEGRRLDQRDIALPSVEAKYFRLSWPLGEQGIALRSIRAEVRQEGGSVPRQWLRLAPSAEGGRQGVYEFSAGGRFPVDRIRVVLPQANTLVRAKLFSSPDRAAEESWRLRHQGLLYHLLREGHTLQNDPITLPGISDPHWRLEIEQQGGGLGRGVPQLELGWVAHRLYFVSRGETPFSLAFGAAGVEGSRSELAPVLKTLQQDQNGQSFIKAAVPGNLYELGGERRLQSAPPPLPWKKWLLWSVLVLGVLLLALMARSLYRQMSEAERHD